MSGFIGRRERYENGANRLELTRTGPATRAEFLEWTDADHLRDSKFVGLREDKEAREVVKEHAGES